ncbi:MAG: hypothetical protein ACJLS2_10065 [Microcella pacifica]
MHLTVGVVDQVGTRLGPARDDHRVGVGGLRRAERALGNLVPGQTASTDRDPGRGGLQRRVELVESRLRGQRGDDAVLHRGGRRVEVGGDRLEPRLRVMLRDNRQHRVLDLLVLEDRVEKADAAAETARHRLAHRQTRRGEHRAGQGGDSVLRRGRRGARAAVGDSVSARVIAGAENVPQRGRVRLTGALHALAHEALQVTVLGHDGSFRGRAPGIPHPPGAHR